MLHCLYVGTDRRTGITQFFCTLLKGTNSKVSSKRLISQVLNYQFIHVSVQPLLWGADRLILTKLPVTWESERGCCTIMEIPFSRVCRKRFNLWGKRGEGSYIAKKISQVLSLCVLGYSSKLLRFKYSYVCLCVSVSASNIGLVW